MKALTFQEIIHCLHDYWSKQGCLVWYPYHETVGAGTANTATLLRVLGPEPWNVGYLEPSFRPDDGRYADNPNRVQMHHQYQVILKPPPENPQQLYLNSLYALGLSHEEHDFRFVEDNWESPALGAWGLGWEVWLDGMEITQFTYFQQAGGVTLDPPACELTYGLERIAMYLQGVDSLWKIKWNDTLTYAELLKDQEIEYCRYNFEHASVERLKEMYELFEAECKSALEKGLIIPAYDYVLKCSHTFNILDARGAVSVSERVKLFGRMRDLCRNVSEKYLEAREELGFPLLKDEEQIEYAPPAKVKLPAKPQTYLFELGFEELAPSVPASIEAQFKEALPKKLEEARLTFKNISVFSTPRRLAVLIDELAPKQTAETQEVKGPRKDVCEKNPKALEGFCKKFGISAKDVQYKEENGQEFAFAKSTSEELSVVDILPEILIETLTKLHLPRGMRWLSTAKDGEDAKQAFNRPIRWIVSLFGKTVIPIKFTGVIAGNTSTAGRWANSPELTITDANSYQKLITKAGIILNADERKKQIEDDLNKAAVSIDGVIKDYNDLLDEVNYLVECPTVFIGAFGDSFNALPPAVLTSVIAKHVRCFPVYSKDGSLLPNFLGVRSGTNKNIDIVRGGFEQVVAARLKDAEFFIGKDSERPLESFLEDIKRLTFHEKIGSVYDKAKRLQKFCLKLSEETNLTEVEKETLQRAATLSKADLGTQMVIEMARLQGEIGSFYALKGGETAEVAQAIREQYYPRFSGDTVPASNVGLLLSVSDKLDNLVALFSVEKEPTGSRDPFGMRRDALGILNCLVEGNRSFDLKAASNEIASELNLSNSEEVVSNVLSFLNKRLEILLREKGFRHDVVRTVLASRSENPCEAFKLVGQLEKLYVQEHFRETVPAYLRCARLVAQSQDKGIAIGKEVKEAALQEDPERKLWDSIKEVSTKIGEINGQDLEKAYSAFEPLTPTIDFFFDKVMVMVEDEQVRENRLGLLNQVVAMLRPYGDLTLLEGFSS